TGGFFGGHQEMVQISLPASAIGEKEGINLLVKPTQYRGTSTAPGVMYYAGKAVFWLYKDTVFVDFMMRKNAAIQTLADQILASSKSSSRRAKGASREPKRRAAIPRQVKIDVWQRDGGRCVECGTNKDLEFDHIIPLKLGGANTFRNLQL